MNSGCAVFSRVLPPNLNAGAGHLQIQVMTLKKHLEQALPASWDIEQALAVLMLIAAIASLAMAAWLMKKNPRYL